MITWCKWAVVVQTYAPTAIVLYFAPPVSDWCKFHTLNEIISAYSRWSKLVHPFPIVVVVVVQWKANEIRMWGAERKLEMGNENEVGGFDRSHGPYRWSAFLLWPLLLVLLFLDLKIFEERNLRELQGGVWVGITRPSGKSMHACMRPAIIVIHPPPPPPQNMREEAVTVLAFRKEDGWMGV